MPWGNMGIMDGKLMIKDNNTMCDIVLHDFIRYLILTSNCSIMVEAHHSILDKRLLINVRITQREY